MNNFLFAGKMGITYPKSLRFYDLRLRYVTTTQTTRSSMEQDFGRACRYVCDGDPPLPTVMSFLLKLLQCCSPTVMVGVSWFLDLFKYLKLHTFR